jgi:hypothetical protein
MTKPGTGDLEITLAIRGFTTRVRRRWIMRRGFIRLLVLGAPLAAGLILGPGRADEPLPPPTRKTIWSNNRRFFAVTDPKDWTTTIYRATPDGKGSKSWAMVGYLRYAWLADDGEHLVADALGGDGLVPLDYDKGHVVLYFLRRGELINKLTIGQVQVIGDLPKLGHTASHYSWGYPVGFDQDGHFVINVDRLDQIAAWGWVVRFDQGGQFVSRTDGNRAIPFDASKGAPQIHAPSKRQQ